MSEKIIFDDFAKVFGLKLEPYKSKYGNIKTYTIEDTSKNTLVYKSGKIYNSTKSFDTTVYNDYLKLAMDLKPMLVCPKIVDTIVETHDLEKNVFSKSIFKRNFRKDFKKHFPKIPMYFQIKFVENKFININGIYDKVITHNRGVKETNWCELLESIQLGLPYMNIVIDVDKLKNTKYGNFSRYTFKNYRPTDTDFEVLKYISAYVELYYTELNLSF